MYAFRFPLHVFQVTLHACNEPSGAYIEPLHGNTVSLLASTAALHAFDGSLLAYNEALHA